MRLGISAALPHASPEEWAQKHKSLGLSAVVFPCDYRQPVKTIDAYKLAAEEAGLCIAEVGAWCNPVTADKKERERNMEKCIRQTELADYVGAKCCVNIAGAAGAVWDGSYGENYSDGHYALTIETVQQILWSAKPVRTDYTLEPMPHMLPDSPESYLQMIRDVNHPHFAVHMDLVNMLLSPRVYFDNHGLMDRCFDLLGPYIRSSHLKDAALDHNLTVSIREVPCGEGGVDLLHYLTRAERLSPQTPMIIEHLSKAEDYVRSIRYIQRLSGSVTHAES